ncbi:hypothetical protein YC2023_117017 [Brassica napus]
MGNGQYRFIKGFSQAIYSMDMCGFVLTAPHGHTIIFKCFGTSWPNGFPLCSCYTREILWDNSLCPFQYQFRIMFWTRMANPVIP